MGSRIAGVRKFCRISFHTGVQHVCARFALFLFRYLYANLHSRFIYFSLPYRKLTPRPRLRLGAMPSPAPVVGSLPKFGLYAYGGAL